MDKPPVFFWQNMPAHHQVGALDAFASLWGAPVTGIWNGDISPERQQEGWRPPPRRHLRNLFLPAEGWESLVDEVTGKHGSAIHIFSGIAAYPQTARAARNILRNPAPKAGLIVETLLKSKVRRIPNFLRGLYQYYPVRRKISAVMAIGSQAETCYRLLGFEAEQIFPYLYQCNAPLSISSEPASTMRLVYLGRLTVAKGLGFVLASLAPLADENWVLDVYGKGADQEKFEGLVKKFGLGGKVRFCGTIVSNAVVPTLADYDLCLVPSLYDGWGMAVSEAVQAGIPSLVSREAGACDLVIGSGAGEVITAKHVTAWTEALRRRFSDRVLVTSEKKLIRAFAPRVSPEVVGSYLVEVMEHVFLGAASRPSAPWRTR